MLPPLWGGGFPVAFAQLFVFYYASGALLHWVVPALGPLKGIQDAPRKPGEVARDAASSIGARAAPSSGSVSVVLLACVQRLGLLQRCFGAGVLCGRERSCRGATAHPAS